MKQQDGLLNGQTLSPGPPGLIGFWR